MKGWKELWPRFFIFPIFQFSNIPLFPSSNIPVGPYDGGIVSDSRLNIEVVSDQRPRIGLLAGWGRYPVVIAEALRREGYAVYCLGIREHADREALEAICDDFEWVGIGRAGTAVRYFRRHGVTKATMAGKFHKKQLFQPRLWLRHAPDLTTIRHFYPYLASPRLLGGSKDRKDDTLLAAVVSLFGRHGIEFKPATDFARSCLLVKDNSRVEVFQRRSGAILSLAGSWQNRWDGWTSDSRSLSRNVPCLPWKRLRVRTNACVAPANCVPVVASPW